MRPVSFESWKRYRSGVASMNEHPVHSHNGRESSGPSTFIIINCSIPQRAFTMDFTNRPPGIGSVIPGSSPASSVSFHSSGKRLFIAREGESRLQVVDCLTGQEDRPALKLSQDTIRLVSATHHEDCVLFTESSKNSPYGQKHSINYMSIYDNKILRKFRGHTDRINSLSLCPENDHFLSASNDRTVRLWNISQAGCVAECTLPPTAEAPLAAFDGTGMVFGVTAQNVNEGHYLHMYDARNHTAGAFAELKIPQASLSQAIVQAAPTMPLEQANALALMPFHSMQFNASGNQILMGSTGGGMSVLLDGFEGTVQKVLINPQTPATTPAVSCFTGDDQCVLSGNTDGSIDVWQVDSGSIVQRLDAGNAGGSIDSLAFNPAYQQFVSGGSEAALWIWGS